MTEKLEVALIAAIAALVTATISAFVAWLTASQRREFERRQENDRREFERRQESDRREFEERLNQIKSDFDRQLADYQDQLDHKAEYAAERVALELFKNEAWPWRTWDILKLHLGGFEDSELRKLLVRTGAIRSYDCDGKEVWGLGERNKDSFGIARLAIRVGQRDTPQGQHMQQQRQDAGEAPPASMSATWPRTHEEMRIFQQQLAAPRE